MSDKLVKLLSTFFYIGYLPLAPGSMATIAGALIAYCLRDQIPAYVLVFAAITACGFLVSDRMEKIVGQKDPTCIVIDEVSGVMIAFFLLPFSWPVIFTAFFLFRAFDMFKIYPVNKFEPMPGGVGVMMDDIVAGVYTNIVMQIAIRWAGFAS